MSKKTKPLPDPALRRKRLVTGVLLVISFAVFVWLSVFITQHFLSFDLSPEEFKTFVESFGWKGRFVALGLQVLQVVVSFIPGEVLEIGIGYAFGAIEGTLLCLGGVALASSLVFTLTKRWGIRLVEVFVDREKINQLRFINSERKLKRLIFILFFIPGTPKDLLTYFAGLTKIRLHEFLVISLIARIPSVVSSTIGGNLIQQQNYAKAALLFLITGAVSLVGIFLYNQLVTHKKRKETEENSHFSEN